MAELCLPDREVYDLTTHKTATSTAPCISGTPFQLHSIALRSYTQGDAFTVQPWPKRQGSDRLGGLIPVSTAQGCDPVSHIGNWRRQMLARSCWSTIPVVCVANAFSIARAIASTARSATSTAPRCCAASSQSEVSRSLFPETQTDLRLDHTCFLPVVTTRIEPLPDHELMNE